MVNLTHKISLTLLCTACLEHLATAQEAPSEPLPISLDADSSTFSQETGTMIFRGLQISQGSMKIEADELGANAIVCMRFTTSTIMSGMAEFLAYGTAVIVEPVPNND